MRCGLTVMPDWGLHSRPVYFGVNLYDTTAVDFDITRYMAIHVSLSIIFALSAILAISLYTIVTIQMCFTIERLLFRVE